MAGEPNLINDILASKLTAESLLDVENKVLLQHSLLILSYIGQLGALDPSSQIFSSLLNEFCTRAASCRPLKLRLALLMSVADLGAGITWKPKVLYDPECYELDFEEKECLEEEESVVGGSFREDSGLSTHSAIDLPDTEELLENDEILSLYAHNRFFNPKAGIDLHLKRRGLRTFQNAFSENAAILFLMQDLRLSSREIASNIVKRMVKVKIIKKVSSNIISFGEGRDIYKRVKHNMKRPSVIANMEVLDQSDARVSVTFRLDIVDIQSIQFWRDTLWERSKVEGSDLGAFVVIHPMAMSGKDSEHDDNDYGGYIVHSVKVEKVFKSMAQPAFLSLSKFTPGYSFLPCEESENKQEINPRIIAKAGDNLINDQAVELMFRVFSHIWQSDTIRFESALKAPFAFSYDVLPTGPKTGLLEVIPGLKPLNDYDWKDWISKNGENEDILDTMVRSAAGCSVAAYILGCGDRHWDNIHIRDGHTMLHIDFGMILGENPLFKTPRFSISMDMENAFKEVGIWEPFVEMCGNAFLSLKDHSSELIHIMAIILYHAGRAQSKILKYLSSKESFNLEETNEEVAKEFVCNQVRSSAGNWETILRKFTHDKVDPLFFKAVQFAPPGLIAAVEMMYEK